MKPSKDNILRVLAALERSGSLPEDGPTSVFLTQGGHGGHAVQLSVRVSGDAVFVRRIEKLMRKDEAHEAEADAGAAGI